MFKIVMSTDGSWIGHVIDEQSGVYLQMICGPGYAGVVGFKLVHPSGVIPFDCVTETGLKDPASGQPYFIRRIVEFGVSSCNPPREAKPLPYTFENDSDKDHWLLIAAEALAVFGEAYNGFDVSNENYTRISIGGDKLYTLNDFDYGPGP